LTKNNAITNPEAINQIKALVLEIVKKQKPETKEQLIQLMQQTHNITAEQTTQLLTELENKNRIKFTESLDLSLTTPEKYLISKNALWYWAIITFIITTMIAVFTIPETVTPIVYLRNVLGAILILFLPGYAFIRVLFPLKVPLENSKQNLTTIERVSLSVGMSLAINFTIGLILNYTPWGLNLTSIALGILALAVVFATVALLREYLNRKQNNEETKYLKRPMIIRK
jgi:uncharacterized membrane protein